MANPSHGEKNKKLLELAKSIQKLEDFSESEAIIFLAEEIKEAILDSNIGKVLGHSACHSFAQKIVLETLKTCDLQDEPEDVYMQTIINLRRELCSQRIRIIVKEKREKDSPADEAFRHLLEAEKLKQAMEVYQEQLKDREDIARGLLVKIMKGTILKWRELKGKDVVIINLKEMTASKKTVVSDSWNDIYGEMPVSQLYVMPFEVYEDAVFKLPLKEDW